MIKKTGSYKQTNSLLTDMQNVKALSSVKLLSMEIDGKLNFNLHIGNVCKSAANQLSEW